MLGVLYCGYCADWGCNARVGVYFRSSCPMPDSSLLSILHRCLSSMSISLWVAYVFYLSDENLMMAGIGRNM